MSETVTVEVTGQTSTPSEPAADPVAVAIGQTIGRLDAMATEMAAIRVDLSAQLAGFGERFNALADGHSAIMAGMSDMRSALDVMATAAVIEAVTEAEETEAEEAEVEAEETEVETLPAADAPPAVDTIPSRRSRWV